MSEVVTCIEKIVRLQKKLQSYQERMDNYEAHIPDSGMWALASHDNIVRACDETEARLDVEFIKLASLKLGHDWAEVAALAKDLKRHYTH